MTNFRLNQENLKLKNFDFDKELKLLDSNFEEIKNVHDEDLFWKKAQLIFESIIKLYRYEIIFVKSFRDSKFNELAYYFKLCELIEEYFLGIKTIKTEIPITENNQFLLKIYQNKFYDPYISILDLDCRAHTRVFLTEEKPQTRKDLKFSTNFKKFKRRIENGFPIDNIEDSIVKWANETNEDGITNWDYAKKIYRIVTDFKGKFKSKNDKFKSYSKLDKLEKLYYGLYTYKFENKFKKRLKSNNRLHKFQLRKLPFTSPIIKYLNNIELPKNFNIIDELNNISQLTGDIHEIHWRNEKKNSIQFIENIIWDRTIKVFKKLRIINKYYKIENFVFDNILYWLSFDSIFRTLFNVSYIKGLEYLTFNFNQSFIASTDFLDPVDPNIRIYDESLKEIGKLFITEEIPQNESDLRFSEDSDKNITPKILNDIVKFANTDNNWERVKDYWRERHFIGNKEKDYPWFKSKDEQFSIK